MNKNRTSRAEYINNAFYRFRGGMAREFYYTNKDYPYILYYYDPKDDCLHADAVSVPFHYREEEITYRIIGETLDALEDALRDYFKKEKGITLYDYEQNC